jgi:hypothetical protein
MAGVITAVDTTVVQHVLVVAAALTAAVGWGTAGADWEKAGQVEMLPDKGQQTHAAVVAIVVVCVDDNTLKTEVEVGDGLDTADDVGTGLGTNFKQPKGLIIFPSLSILLSLKII